MHFESCNSVNSAIWYFFFSPMSWWRTNSCIVMVFCTHLTAHRGFDTSITQPVEFGLHAFLSRLKVTAAVKSAHPLLLFYDTLWWGAAVCPDTCTCKWSSGMSVIVVCPQQPEIPPECRTSIGRLGFFLSQSAYRYFTEHHTIQHTTSSLRRSYFALM